MPVGQWKTLTIREELKERLQRSFESDTKKVKNQSFSSWLDNVLSDMVDQDETVQKYGKFIEVLSYDDNHVLLMDNWHGKHYFVEIAHRPGAIIFCQDDASTVCMHVGFCLSLPEVYKALAKRGYTPMRLKARKLIKGPADKETKKEISKAEKRWKSEGVGYGHTEDEPRTERLYLDDGVVTRDILEIGDKTGKKKKELPNPFD